MKDNKTVDNICKQLSIAVELTEYIKKIVIFKCKEDSIEQERKNVQQQMKKSQKAKDGFASKEIDKINKNKRENNRSI